MQADKDKLEKKLAEAQVDPQEDIETVETCRINMEGLVSMARPAYTRLIGTGESFDKVAESMIKLCDRIHDEMVEMIIKNDKVTQYE